MGTEGSTQHTVEDTLAVFTEEYPPGTPLTTAEVGEELDCARRTAYGKLETLAEDGKLETKKVGARGRIWWRPVGDADTGHERTDATLEQAQFDELAETVTDYAIFVLDSEGRVRTWNEGARELKGYEEGEIVGEHVSTFYTEDDRAAGRAERNLEVAAEEGRVQDEGQRLRKDGTTFWASVTITALYEDDGSLRGYAKVTRDMTERHEYETRLRAQRDELDELDQINQVIRGIDQALVAATTREEIEQAVCERLADSAPYAAAWIGEYAEDYGSITPRSWAGIDEGYLEAIRTADADADDDTERGVGATALRTRTIQPVQQLGSEAAGEPWQGASLDAGYESAITVPLVHNEVEYGVLTVYAADASAFDERKIAVMSELGETISHAITAVRRKEREQTLTALQTSTRELLHAETEAEIGDTIVGTLTEDLPLAEAVVYYFDTTTNVLEPVSSSVAADSPASQLRPLTAGADSPIWTVFVEDEIHIADAVAPMSGIGGRRSMVLPLGDHGVLAVATGEGEAFDRDTRNLVELVAATAEAAFDRVESQATLRERDELLQEQNARLQRLNGINTIIREVDQGLVQAAAREEIERIVCERLTASDRFRFAWIGVPADVGEGVTPRAWSGEDRGYLDSVDLGGEGTTGDEPAVVAARTGEVTVVSNVAEDLRGGNWQKEAFSREFQSVISVPLSYGNVTYGALAVYADRPEVFEEMEQSVFAELGETVANAINAVDTQQALLSDRAIELEFALSDPSDSFLGRLARQLDVDITYEGVIPLSEDRSRLFFSVRDAPPAAIEDVLDRSVAVESNGVVATREDSSLVEAVVTAPTVAGRLVEQGSVLRSLTASDQGVDVVVNVPASADVRAFIERFESRFESAAFLARRERERSIGTPQGLYAELGERLTDRQLEVLETAYYSGFFDSPRRSTGGDIADLLGVSQPTVTEQLRTAERTVLDLLFADPPASE